MFKIVNVNANINENTGYGLHAKNFFPALQEKLAHIEGGEGAAWITLIDAVGIQNINERCGYPSILYSVWESTEWPQWFIDRLQYFDQLWVPSEWQKSVSIAQGIPEEFIRVVPEGVDPAIFKPLPTFTPFDDHFSFLHVGKWEHRKSTGEIIAAFLTAFPNNDKVRLYVSVDTNFPTDNYKTTEERLVGYGLDDPRVIPIHFTDQESYIRNLQSAHIFVSCSRAEGWNLPLIEAMACGTPSICADYSGSTEFAQNAIKVRVPELKKPEGIYGNWDVPGLWGEPDYDDLVTKMRLSYKYWDTLKQEALKESENIRNNFSWERAADKAYEILQELSEATKDIITKEFFCPEQHQTGIPSTTESDIRLYASNKGYEITGLRKRSAIFAVDCWPSSQEKMDTLIETIDQIHALGYPVLITTHYPLPPLVIEKADYYLYEQRDILSGDDKPIYWRRRLDGTEEHKRANVEYHGVACLNTFRNAIDFCRDRYDWIYQMGADMEVDLEDWLSKVLSSTKDMICMSYEGDTPPTGIGGGLWAGKTEILDQVIPRLNSWKEYADKYPDVRFVAERWIYRHVASVCDANEKIDWITLNNPTRNRFDSVDRTVWDDDDFQFHFVEGPFLNIIGLSNREYDVTFGNPIDGHDFYTTKLRAGMWSRPTPKFYRDWTITAKLNGEIKFQHHMDLNGKRVLISMGSKALGDTLAWMPYINKFGRKHNCHVVCSSWWNNIFDYPDIDFVEPGSEVHDVYASYEVGCYDNQPDKNPLDWRTVPLQQVAADILGIDYEPIKAKLKIPQKFYHGHQKPYICFSEFSTMKGKFWNNPGGWQEVIDYCNTMGFDCVSISKEKSNLKDIISHNGQSIGDTIKDINGCVFYVGLTHGPFWLAYSLNKPSVMIVGMTEEWNEPPNPYRVQKPCECKPCFNDTSVPIDRDYNWCPAKANFQCTRNIKPTDVIEKINQLISDQDTFIEK